MEVGTSDKIAFSKPDEIIIQTPLNDNECMSKETKNPPLLICKI